MPNLIHWLAMSSLESSLKFEPRVSRNGGGGLATIVPSDDPFSTLWAMVIRLLENCPSEFIPGSSKKTAIRHNVPSYAPSPPYPLTSMLQLCGLELPTKMAVFFEGLRQQLWITTLKLGVRGRSSELLRPNVRWLFFLKNPDSIATACGKCFGTGH